MEGKLQIAYSLGLHSVASQSTPLSSWLKASQTYIVAIRNKILNHQNNFLKDGIKIITFYVVIMNVTVTWCFPIIKQ